MRRVLLVTAREYWRTTTLPAFWVTALIVPMFVVLAPVAQSLLGASRSLGYVIVDKSGHYEAPIKRRLERAYQRQVLVQLLTYAGEWRSSGNTPSALDRTDSESTSSLSDAAVENFMAAGGAPAILRELKPLLRTTAPPFQVPVHPLVEIPLPDGVTTESADRFGSSIAQFFRQPARASTGTIGLAVAIFIPDRLNSGSPARVWTNNPASAELVQDLRAELSENLRLEALHSAGVDPLSAVKINDLGAPVTIEAPELSTARADTTVRSILPIALAYLLLGSTIITGSMMLQGLIEERSNKLLEAVLACVSPRELMAGKLAGISAVGLSIVVIWVSAVVAVIKIYPASPLGFLVPALGALRQTPWTIVAMVFYFLAGYLVIGMIFLAVGLLRDNMLEAQAYLTPIALLIVLPSVGLASLIYRDPNALAPRILSWIPLYTPVAMLARLQSGISRVELFGSVLLLLAFGALELVVLGRLFDDHVIQTGSSRRIRFNARTRPVLAIPLAVVVLAVLLVARARRSSTQGDAETATLRSHGEAIFNTACAGCHDPAVGRAPNREQLALLRPAEIASSLVDGTMKPMAAMLDTKDIRALTTYLTGHPPSMVAPLADPPACGTSAGFGIKAGDWNGWSINPSNSRFQPTAGLAADDISRLRVKWAFSYTGGNYGQPTLVGGRLFLTSRSGAIYSLDAKTGCMFWRFSQSTPSRTTISIGPSSKAPSGYAAYFGDTSATVYGVDAISGTLLWKTRVDSHPRATLTGSPTLFKGRLYVPVSSTEEGVAVSTTYNCCTFRGSVAALDSDTGEIRWRAFAIDRPAAPYVKNSAGVQMYGPAGAAVWSSPTIDAKRGRLYFATGNSYTDVKENGSDAVVAVNLENGQTIWQRQVTANDNDLSGCTGGRKLLNCPSARGYDYDFGASPVLVPLSSGTDVVIAGQKSGTVFGLRPETGEVLWRTQVGVGGFLGGVQWGMASDGQYLYVANADAVVSENGRPGLLALDPATGKDVWFAPSPKVDCGWDKAPCFNAQSAAPFAIPGVVFAGTTDGHERAYRMRDGQILWDFDTGHGTYLTTNGVNDQAGGAIEVASGTLGDGMLYVISGYRGILGGHSDNVLLAFSVDGR